MIKFKTNLDLDKIVICERCRKQVRMGQCAVGYKDYVCIDCARKGEGKRNEMPEMRNRYG